MSVAKAKMELENLRERSLLLEREIIEIADKILKISNYIEISETYGYFSAQENLPSQTIRSVSSAMRSSTDRVKIATLPRNVRGVIKILEDEGQPLPTRQLVEKLKEKGIIIGGKNPVTGLSSALSRHKSLLRPSRTDGWSLTSWDNQYADEGLFESRVEDVEDAENCKPDLD